MIQDLEVGLLEDITSLDAEVLEMDDPRFTERSNLEAAAFRLAYEDMGVGVLFQEDDTQGLLVKMGEGYDAYNNGVYIIQQTDEGYTQLRVVRPNTKDKSQLITNLVQEVTTHIESLDTADLQPYDYMVLFSHVIANILAKPLAKQFFGDNRQLGVPFINQYMVRTLGDMALYYVGTEVVNEEAVNSAPFIVKGFIDGTLKVPDSSEMVTNEEGEPIDED